MGRGVLDDERILPFCHGDGDMVNSFLSGVIEATPNLGANGAFWYIGEGETGSNR
jgi:hypothetical protein